MGRTYVLLHGAFHGGWCWDAVADRLRAAGHRVTTPTQTGLGERRHLLSAAITLETFVTDLVEHMEAEEVEEAILVGHSFGGNAITGAADRIPHRIRHLVYLDAMVLGDGDTPWGCMPAGQAEERRRAVMEQGGGIVAMPPPVAAFGVPEDHPRAAWLRRRMTPHPAGTYRTPLHLRHPPGNGLPRSYIACTDPWYAPLAWARERVKTQPGWNWLEIATGHDAMVTAPEELARMLLAIG
ncbi:alpha/beta hydrolase [Belnapia sp. T6]|uniref:Alpha/beta hydrolase n=1 Tax=Belnapia mucosa TaxID=2804532 RepID=A0ABS1V040_9PROT|nr:alpha/beta hydrolase [Belnapia mucosa]MBL6455080.1 alpha/beta hydrolase [Belnapia mucosa]